MTELMIEAHGLKKRFGSTVALDGLDLEVPTGAILGVLGPNGAGKTTAIRILTTLAGPTPARRALPGTTWCDIRAPCSARSASPHRMRRSTKSSPVARTS